MVRENMWGKGGDLEKNIIKRKTKMLYETRIREEGKKYLVKLKKQLTCTEVIT